MVFGGINKQYQPMNSIEKFDMNFRSTAQWELMTFKSMVLPEMQNSRMVQVNFDEICIFARNGYCYYFDVGENKVTQSMYKPDMKFDSVNMPALLTEAGVIVTGCSKTQEVVEFKYNRPFQRICKL